MDRRAAWVIGLVFGGLFLCLFAFLALAWAAVYSGRSGGFARGDRVGVVEVLGVITDGKTNLQEIRAVGENDRLPAIVLRVGSPGGAGGPPPERWPVIQLTQA